jgi:phosphoribosyl 1,2-cyclic phosphate phosphodiesterase
MSTKFTLLGTGSSGGVPRVGPVWGACDPTNPKNRRRRCALLVERFDKGGRTGVLVDTPADIREQLLAERVETLDGVLYTHDHADHTHGIDDLRGVFFNMRRRVRVWADAPTRKTLEARFDYCFQQKPGSIYPAILQAHDIEPPHPVRIEGSGGAIEAVPIPQDHGDSPSLGFRFGNVAYSPDIGGIPESSIPLLQGLDLWIVDALRPMPHPSHFSVKQAVDWVERLGVKRAILTHMTVELDYEALRRQLPAHVEPGYDGMVVEVDR